MDTPQRLYLMQLSTAEVPIGEGRTLSMVCVCYLVQTKEGKNILIDTGLPADYAQPGMPPFQNPRNVIAQLADLGLQPDDIDTLICTHFDPDHAGYNDSFPNAELIVQRAHYEVAKTGHPRYESVRAHWDHPALHYRFVDGDIELIPGLTLIETSGHAPAHQSVLVKLPNTGAVLLAIDAVSMQHSFTPERIARPNDDNQDQLRASTQKLLDIAEREHVAFTVFGHDGQQWKTLKHCPEFYD